MEYVTKESYEAIWDGDSFIDGKTFDTLEDAIDCCLDVLAAWVESFWADHSEIDERAVDEWNCMINNCGVWVNCNDEEVWSPSEEDLENIGWAERNA